MHFHTRTQVVLGSTPEGVRQERSTIPDHFHRFCSIRHDHTAWGRALATNVPAVQPLPTTIPLHHAPGDFHWRPLLSCQHFQLLSSQHNHQDQLQVSFKLNTFLIWKTKRYRPIQFRVISKVTSLYTKTYCCRQRDGGEGNKVNLTDEDPLSLDNASLQYYLQLSPQLLAKVITFYTTDFKLFGYQVPSILLDRARLWKFKRYTSASYTV